MQRQYGLEAAASKAFEWLEPGVAGKVSRRLKTEWPWAWSSDQTVTMHRGWLDGPGLDRLPHLPTITKL